MLHNHSGRFTVELVFLVDVQAVYGRSVMDRYHAGVSLKFSFTGGSHVTAKDRVYIHSWPCRPMMPAES